LKDLEAERATEVVEALEDLLRLRPNMLLQVSNGTKEKKEILG
jgi:hypothetical protein